jgi:hypothetical protein
MGFFLLQKVCWPGRGWDHGRAVYQASRAIDAPGISISNSDVDHMSRLGVLLVTGVAGVACDGRGVRRAASSHAKLGATVNGGTQFRCARVNYRTVVVRTSARISWRRAFPCSRPSA